MAFLRGEALGETQQVGVANLERADLLGLRADLPVRCVQTSEKEATVVGIDGLEWTEPRAPCECGRSAARCCGSRRDRTTVDSLIVPVRKPLPERAKRDEPDPELLESRDDLLLRLPPPQRVLALERLRPAAPRARDGSSATPASDRPKCLTFPSRDELACTGTGDVLDRDVRVDSVLVKQIDRVGPEPAERTLRPHPGSCPGRLSTWPVMLPVLDMEPELGSDNAPDRAPGRAPRPDPHVLMPARAPARSRAAPSRRRRRTPRRDIAGRGCR